jgi:hypothetical protein
MQMVEPGVALEVLFGQCLEGNARRAIDFHEGDSKSRKRLSRPSFELPLA